MKLTPFLICLAIFPLVAPVASAQQGAAHGENRGAQRAITDHTSIIKRRVTDTSAALGPPRTPAAGFDSQAFRNSASLSSTGLSPQAQLDPQTEAAALILPHAFIEATRSGTGALSGGSAGISDVYFRESKIGLGFYYGYKTPRFALDVSARTVTSVPAGQEPAALSVDNGRFPISETRDGYFGTVRAGNVSYAIEITCGSDPVGCITQDELERLYRSLLSCEADNQCYEIGELDR